MNSFQEWLAGKSKPAIALDKITWTSFDWELIKKPKVPFFAECGRSYYLKVELIKKDFAYGKWLKPDGFYGHQGCVHLIDIKRLGRLL